MAFERLPNPSPFRSPSPPGSVTAALTSARAISTLLTSRPFILVRLQLSLLPSKSVAASSMPEASASSLCHRCFRSFSSRFKVWFPWGMSLYVIQSCVYCLPSDFICAYGVASNLDPPCHSSLSAALFFCLYIQIFRLIINVIGSSLNYEAPTI